jgi:hypothetical protein
MSFIRTSMSVIISTILLISLILLSVFSVLQWSSNYNVLKPTLIAYSKNLLGEGNPLKFDMSESYSVLQEHCVTHTNYILNEGSIHLEIPCEIINQGMDSVIDYGVDNALQSVYYKNYSCKFLNCIQQENNPLVFVSEKTHLFMKSAFYILLLISGVLFLFLFLLVKRKSNSFLIIGILMVLVSLIIRSMDFFLALISKPFLKNVIGLFFSKSHAVFLIFLIIGIASIFVGILIKALKLEIKIAERFSKRNKNEKINIDEDKVRKIVKEEMKKKSRTNKKSK